MKRHLFVPLLFAAAVVLTGCQKSDEALMAEAKSTIVSSCKSSAAEAPNVSEAQIGAFCECSAEAFVNAAGIEGVRDLSKRDEITPADEALMQQASMQCIDKLVPAGE